MTDDYYIVIAYGERVIFRDSTILKPDKQYKEKLDDIELYIDRLVKVPDEISEDEAEKLIREKKAYRFNPSKAYDEIKKKILKNNKHLSREDFKRKIATETRKLIQKIRVLDKEAFGKDLDLYENAFKKVSEQIKKAENKDIKNNNN